MSVFFNLKSLKTIVDKIHLKFPEQKIIVGGQGFRWGGSDYFKAYTNVQIIQSLDEMKIQLFN